MRKPVRSAFLLIVALASSLAGLVGCHKVPLKESWGDFDLVAAHWFENEKTQYVFFSIGGLKADQAKSGWPSAFELSVDKNPYSPLDFSKAVHRHRIVPCGEGRLCGSYSLKMDQPATSIQLRFRYHVESSLKRETSINNSVHWSGSAADSQSALVYGVFDAANERMQVRVHDNFGTPNSDEIRKFGMDRTFEVRDVSLSSLTEEQEREVARSSGTALLFPAAPCEALIKKAGGVTPFRAHEAWVAEKIDAKSEGNVACFRARAIDQRGELLNEKPAMARRNPVLAGDTTILRTPLRETRRIPVVISYCQQSAGDSALASPLFLDYQRFILGLGKAPVDLCFAVGGEDKFASDLERVLNQKIAEARAASNAGGREGLPSSDFMLVLAVNHRLAPIVSRFHQILAEKLNRKVAEERAMHSPRLVGAFVYDSSPAEERGVNLQAGVIWCPRLEPKGEGKGEPVSPTAANCIGFRGGKADFGLFNFVIPMGPFPTLDAYENHVRELGDRGWSRNPELSFQSVLTDVNSVNLPDQTVTFFDGERLTLQKGEGLRVCRERDEEGILDNLMFRVTVEGGEAPMLRSPNDLQGFARSVAAKTNLEVGIGWEQPFWGGLSFEIPVEGKVLSVIPLNFSARERQKMGDGKWQRSLWPVGALLQKCTKYCDHPYFDEAGVYQVSSTWRGSWTACPRPRYPEPNE